MRRWGSRSATTPGRMRTSRSPRTRRGWKGNWPWSRTHSPESALRNPSASHGAAITLVLKPCVSSGISAIGSHAAGCRPNSTTGRSNRVRRTIRPATISFSSRRPAMPFPAGRSISSGASSTAPQTGSWCCSSTVCRISRTPGFTRPRKRSESTWASSSIRASRFSRFAILAPRRRRNRSRTPTPTGATLRRRRANLCNRSSRSRPARTSSDGTMPC